MGPQRDGIERRGRGDTAVGDAAVELDGDAGADDVGEEGRGVGGLGGRCGVFCWGRRFGHFVFAFRGRVGVFAHGRFALLCLEA